MDICSNNSNFELFIKLEWFLYKKESIRELSKEHIDIWEPLWKLGMYNEMDIRSNNSNYELFIKLEWLLCKKESIREF